jgi:hypothetical protein
VILMDLAASFVAYEASKSFVMKSVVADVEDARLARYRRFEQNVVDRHPDLWR